MKQSKEFAPTTIISAGSCVNSKMKLNFDVNFMDHVLVKDIIKKTAKGIGTKTSLCVYNGTNVCFKCTRNIGHLN